MYHRIADLETDPWQLGVNHENFEEQLEALKSKFHVVSVSELDRQLSERKIVNNSIALTFDDTYTDNYSLAFPLLKKYELPATFFVPTDYLGKRKEFWWDELEEIILRSAELPGKISITIGGNNFDYVLADTVLTKDMQDRQKWWVYYDPPVTERCDLFYSIWQLLKPMNLSEIEPVVAEVKRWANYQQPQVEGNWAMTPNQLKEIVDHPLFEIGIHTATHAALEFHSRDVQKNEILDCKNYLENFANKAITTIAYPYGSYNEITLEVSGQQNISLAFTTQEEKVNLDSNRLALGRFQATNQNGKEFEKQLKEWLG
jgi:peptidoglycan/xylan/chitin deacetylase (PgdA/CDA1 family)